MMELGLRRGGGYFEPREVRVHVSSATLPNKGGCTPGIYGLWVGGIPMSPFTNA